MKNNNHITIVADSFPPTIGGIGDYAIKLGEYWPKDCFSIRFLSFHNAIQSQHFLKNKDVVGFDSTSGSMSTALQNSDIVVLNYNPIAFSRFGFPLWMIRELSIWRRQCKNGKLLLIAHELWSNQPLTSKFFLRELLSKYTSIQLAKLSNKIVCVTQGHFVKLSCINRSQDIIVLPAPSNISPPLNPKAWSRRRPGSFVLFGLNHTRYWTLELFFPYLLDWAKHNQLREIFVIGPQQGKWELLEKQLLDQLNIYCIVNICGELPAESISSILEDCQFGLTNQAEDSLLKSGSFMAVASHGCVILSPFANEASAPPLKFLHHPDNMISNLSNITASDSRLISWYRDNCSWNVVVQQIFKHMELE